jgi:hypothetical protein
LHGGPRTCHIAKPDRKQRCQSILASNKIRRRLFLLQKNSEKSKIQQRKVKLSDLFSEFDDKLNRQLCSIAEAEKVVS